MPHHLHLTLLLTILYLQHLVQAGNNTVTSEVFLDVVVEDIDGDGNALSGRLVFALFGHVAPISTLNFRLLCEGYHRPRGRWPKNFGYKGSVFHRVIKDFVIQGGDIDSQGGRSVFGTRFDDEEFVLSHRTAGYLSWANHGPDSNASQFFITLVKARWLDSKHLVFGKLIRGYDLVNKIGSIDSNIITSLPMKKIKVTDSGSITTQPYDISDEGMSTDGDIKEKHKLPATDGVVFTKEGGFKPTTSS